MPIIIKNCEFCKKEFKTVQRKKQETKCCSRKCSNLMKKGKPSPKKGIKLGKYKNSGLPKEYLRKQNKFQNMGDYFIGYDNKGIEFYFDSEDFEKVNKYCWRVKKNGYVYSYTREIASKRKTVLLHRLVMDFPKTIIDHIDRNPRNNKKNNLELSNHSKNNMNKGLTKSNTSGYTGVNYIKRTNKWSASIKKDNNLIWLGYHTMKEEAIKARQEAEIKYFGKVIKRE